ncbi:MAG: hypothetical protein B7Z47_06345, partial [Chthoniobacter sp. 12-60-6]
SSASVAALILGADNGGFNWGGVIKQEVGAGAMSFLKSSPQQYNFLNANTYSGATVFAGGVNLFADGGTLSNTSSIGVNYAYFRLDDNVNFALANRVNINADITLKGGSLVYVGRTQTETSQSVGNVILAEGYNMIQSANGGTGINSATLNILSLTRTAGSTATLRIPDNGSGAIGSTGRVLITSLNGVLTSTNAGGVNINSGGLVNGLIGPWAVVDREFASYIPDYGVGRLNQTGFAGYSINTLNGTPIATDNIRVIANVGLLADTTVSTLAINPSGALAAIDLGGNKLTLQGGGLLLALSGANRSIVIGNGTITAGTLNTDSDLYVHVLPYGQLGSSTVINADIMNNGTGKVRLVVSGSDGQANLTLNGSNTYSGGTVINGGVLIIGATGSIGHRQRRLPVGQRHPRPDCGRGDRFQQYSHSQRQRHRGADRGPDAERTGLQWNWRRHRPPHRHFERRRPHHRHFRRCLQSVQSRRSSAAHRPRGLRHAGQHSHGQHLRLRRLYEFCSDDSRAGSRRSGGLRRWHHQIRCRRAAGQPVGLHRCAHRGGRQHPVRRLQQRFPLRHPRPAGEHLAQS